jgi:tRNA threonylcarbamoyladenosine biosynthesis protein TsaE
MPGDRSSLEPLTLTLAGEQATLDLAARLAPLAERGDVFCLMGDLGTGKTTFARGFIRARARAAGVAAEEVPSPTFTLVQVYEIAPVPVWHFDLYRLEAAREAVELGIEEAFATAVSLIEWAERLGHRLPPDRLELRFAYVDAENGDGVSRRVTLVPFGTWRARLAALKLDGR